MRDVSRVKESMAHERTSLVPHPPSLILHPPFLSYAICVKVRVRVNHDCVGDEWSVWRASVDIVIPISRIRLMIFRVIATDAALRCLQEAFTV
jgi:hypothetical protein